MNPLLVLKAEWRRSRMAVLALALVLGLAVAPGLALSMLDRGIRQGTAHAGDHIDLLVGAPGSTTQLVLSAVYLQPQPLPLLPHSTYTELQSTAGVAWAAPLAFGDRWGDAPIIGTNQDMVTLGGTRPVAMGRNFAAHTEAVIGASVPLELGVHISPSHGQLALPDGNHEHERELTVVGRLPATGSPWDTAILIPVEAVWEMHDLAPEAPEAGISAVVVKPVSLADAYKLRARWQTPASQAAFTGEVLTNLFATLGDVHTLLRSMAFMSQGIALGAVILATLFAVSMRRDTLMLLRVLGAPRRYLMLTVWLAAACVVVLGVGAGVGIGLGAAHAAAACLSKATATALPVALTLTEWKLTAGAGLLGLAVASLPALLAYRRLTF